MNRLLYAHPQMRSSPIAFVQLTIWTVTGFLFSAIPQQSLKSAPVEGAHHGVIGGAPAVPIARAIELAAAAGPVERVELRAASPAGPYYA